MAVESAIGASIAIDDAGGNARTLSAYCTQLSFNTPRGVQDISSIDASGMKRLLLRSDFQMNATFVFEDGSNTVFDTFKTAGTYDSSRTVTFVVSSQTLTVECVLSDVAYSVGADGSLTIATTFALQSGTDPTWS